MPEIRILSDQVANQIAAGEVVERPVAVLKRTWWKIALMQRPKKIEIEFRNGGKSYLRVEDDGMGMKPDQALLALERHATSKIRKASDLNKVGTFGFGEKHYHRSPASADLFYEPALHPHRKGLRSL